MPTRAASVPAESDILCESCGYTLNGLPDSGNCPECGAPIAISTTEAGRELSPYERSPGRATFIDTTWQILTSPTRFFRHLSVRAATREAARFERTWTRLAALLFYVALVGHAVWTYRLDVFRGSASAAVLIATVVLGFPIVLYAIRWTRKLATLLTSLEARYWGMRLPLNVVTRALQFHTPQYAPVGIVAILVTWGYQLLLVTGIVDGTTASIYIYTLSGVVIVAAIYLFQTYWIAMRNIMYANR